jgi:hypothetical protein
MQRAIRDPAIEQPALLKIFDEERQLSERPVARLCANVGVLSVM